VRLRDRRLLAPELDSWLAPAAVLVVYGASEIAGGYGFLAAFAGGVAFRRYEREHEYNARVHYGAEVVEKFGELAIILMLGSSLTSAGLEAAGADGWLLVLLLLVVIRPVAVTLSLTAERFKGRERLFVAWFGVRGIGSLYYAALAVGLGVFSAAEVEQLVWTVIACIVTSIVVHGVTATPLSRRWVP
jgi:NhaP-type Na+/H+ or K+/H+ antiporter